MIEDPVAHGGHHEGARLADRVEQYVARH
jgi:hypothetical protein